MYQFSAIEQKDLSRKKARDVAPSKKVAHAVVSVEKTQGKRVVTQYTSQPVQDKDTPIVVPIKNISLVEAPGGGVRATAISDDGQETPMISKRCVHFDLMENGKRKNQELLLFSPKASYKRVFSGSIKSTANVNTNIAQQTMQSDLASQSIVPEVRGGEFDIVREDVMTRRHVEKRTSIDIPDQNMVMEGSAINACKNFISQHKDKLKPDMLAMIEHSVAADKHLYGDLSQPRPEWLHATGYILTPLTHNPQVRTNLGAAPKWLNTKMMTIEELVRWFATYRLEAVLHLKSQFSMLPDSDLIEKGYIEATICEGDKTLIVAHHLDPWTTNPVYSKSTDIAQTTMVAYAVLTKEKPLSEESVVVQMLGQPDYDAGYPWADNANPQDLAEALVEIEAIEQAHRSKKPRLS